MQWEYYRLATVESCMDDALQELGQEGWELVSILPETRLFHGYQCMFKRATTTTAKDEPRANTAALHQRYSKILPVR